jgi:hypothetical protein
MMDLKQLIQQLELYSNAIIAFMVIQGLTYCYQIGTNEHFSKILKTHVLFSAGLTLLFLVVLILALYANYFLGKKLEELNDEYKQLVKTIYFGKAIVIGMFGFLPFIITLIFGVMNGLVASHG